VDQVIGQIRFATAPYLLKPAGSLADGIFAMALVITLCGDHGWAPTRRRRNNGRR